MLRSRFQVNNKYEPEIKYCLYADHATKVETADYRNCRHQISFMYSYYMTVSPSNKKKISMGDN